MHVRKSQTTDVISENGRAFSNSDVRVSNARPAFGTR